MSRRDEDVNITCCIIRETDAAVQIEVEGEEYWIPLSQVSQIHRDAKGEGSVLMTKWIAQKKGLA
jgi:hypothetical protein